MSDANNSAIPPASVERIEEHPTKKWTYCYYNYVDGTSWEENLKHVVYIDDDIYIWHLSPNLEFNKGCNYSMFKEGIRPAKKDPHNINGGRWVTSLNPEFETDNEVERIWGHVCMGLEEEALQDNDDVNGITLDIKGREYTIAYWVRDSSNEKAVLEIGEVMKDYNGEYWDSKLEFIEHKAESLPIKPKYVL